MRELTWIIDQTTGDLLVEGRAAAEALDTADDLLPPGRELGCARPLTILPPPHAPSQEIETSICVRIAGYYHNSLTEGPGRRSTVLFQSCPLKCKGCWTPQLHSPDAGTLVPVERLASVLLDPGYERDGISILGGEPMVQPEGLLALVHVLRSCGCLHILCYSGYTYEVLRARARHQPAIDGILDAIDVLVDGPYVEALAGTADSWTGSGNQRAIDLIATRRADRVVLLDADAPHDGTPWSSRPGTQAAFQPAAPA